MDPINNFTPRAQQVLVLARQEADRFHQTYVGTEHLLLGILELGQGIAFNALERLGVDNAVIRERIEQRVSALLREPIQPLFKASPQVPFTPQVKKVLILAAKEARGLQHSYIGTEHLLLALLRESEGIASEVLRELHLDVQECRQAILSELDPQFTGDVRKSAEGGDFHPPDPSPTPDEALRVETKTPALRAFSRDLTALAQGKHLDPVVGRDREIERSLQILCRRTKNNPALIGEAGVGKTAIVEGLAQAIIAKRVPLSLQDKRILSLDLALMVAGTKYRGQFEERFKAVLEEVRRAQHIILFLDELHTLVGAGASEGSMDASNMLKPALSRGEIQCIGATTFGEYRKHIEKDAALERRFQSIIVEAPNVPQAIHILQGIQSCYEAHHSVTYTPQAVELAVRLSDRYIQGRSLPDKAIDILDEAGSYAHLHVHPRPPALVNTLQRELEEVVGQKERAIRDQRFEEAAQLRDREKQLREQRASALHHWREQLQSPSAITIDEACIYHTVSNYTGIPLERMEPRESQSWLSIEEELQASVIGQSEAIAGIARSLRRARADFRDPKRPIASFLLLGPSGVGKTHLAKVLAEKAFGSADALISVDMTEYLEKFSASRLIGSPPGYIGHEEGGQLTEAVRRKPYSVLLFDEIEKAHQEVLPLFLQILEEGHLTDSLGRKVDFRNTLLLMTSNVGAEFFRKNGGLGFPASGQGEFGDFEATKDRVLEEVKKAFRPEFLNRLSESIVFRPLSRSALAAIVQLDLDALNRRLVAKGISVRLSQEMRDFLIQKGYDPKCGARPLRRAIERHVEDPLAEAFLRGSLREGMSVQVGLGPDGRTLFRSRRPMRPTVATAEA